MKPQTKRNTGTPRNRILPAVISLILAGGAATNVGALELGSATVRSAIGERLIVEIPVNNLDNAQSDCFVPTISGITGYGTLRLQQRSDALILRTTRVIREPMLDLKIDVTCPNVPRLQRIYTLFIDPAQRMSEAQRTLSAPVNSVRVASVRPAPNRRTIATRRPSTTRATGGTNYEVQRGDSVSAIAMRIKSPDQDMWAVVDEIVAANPAAFVNANPDRLMAGAILALPAASAVVAANVSPPLTLTTPDTTTPPPSTPTPTPTPTPGAIVEAPTELATTRQTAALLSVLRDASSLETELETPTATPATTISAPQAVDSPFKAAAPAATDSAPPVTQSPTALPNTAESSWLDRIVALMVGMAGAIALWMLWQIVAGASARTRRVKAGASIPVQPVRDLAPAARLKPREAAPWRAPVDPTHKRDVGIEVTRLDLDFGQEPEAQLTPVDIDLGATVEMQQDDASLHDTANDTMPQFAAPNEADMLEDTMSGEMAALDDETQKLLEQDYEEQLTRTQQLSRDMAAKALGIPVASDGSATEQLPQLDVDPYVDDDDRTLNQSVIIEGPDIASPYDEDITITANMSLDLDLADDDFDEVSGLLRSPADDLVHGGDDYEYDDDDLEHDKTAVLPRKASSQ